MFNSIGMGELVLIGVIALIVIGPEKFPEYAKIAMRAYRDLRGYVDDIKSEMGKELRPIKGELNHLSRYNPEEYIDKLASAVTAAVEEEPGSSTSTTTPAAVESTAAVESAPAPQTSADIDDPYAGTVGETARDTEPEKKKEEYRYED